MSALADDVQLGVCVTRGLDDDIGGRTVLDPRSVLLPTNNQLPPQGSGRRPEGKKCVKIKCHHLDIDQKMSAMVSPSTNLSFRATDEESVPRLTSVYRFENEVGENLSVPFVLKYSYTRPFSLSDGYSGTAAATTMTACDAHGEHSAVLANPFARCHADPNLARACAVITAGN